MSGSKTMDVTTSPEVVNFELLTDVIANKMAKEEWSCALCQVMATSEKDLNEHLTGKKHKSKVAAMRTQRTGKNYSIGLCNKKATKSIDIEEERVKLKARSSFSGKAGKANATSKQDDLTFSENPQSEYSKKTQAEVIREVQKNEDYPRKKVQKNEKDPRKKECEFWCELCQVGTLSCEVMNAHKLGKKHVRHSTREQYGGTDSFNQMKSSVLVNPTEDVSGIGRSIDLGKLNQALDEISSEDCMLLDEVEHNEQEGNSEVVIIELPEVVKNELPPDVIASKKSKEECSSALRQLRREWERKASACNVVNIELPEVVSFELPKDVDADKKSKEWSCALCQVICTREKDLEEHMLGKKHKSNEAALRAKMTGETCSVKLFPKKTMESINMEKVGVKLKAQSLFSEKGMEKTSKKNDLPLLENPQSENLAKTQAEVIQKVQKNDDDTGKEVQKNENDPRRKGCEFWCELCKVGTLSIEVMNAHKLGKKHVSRSRCEQYGGIDSCNQNKSSVFVDPVEDFYQNVKNINLGKLNQALDEVSSEDCMLLDEVEHREREGKSLDYEVVNIELPKVVNFELLADFTASKKCKEECSFAHGLVLGEWEGKASACNVVNIELPEVVNFELPADVDADKKSKEWRCALCQVICNREKDLEVHMHGKKHKSNEAALRAKMTGETCSVRLFPKKTMEPIYMEKVGVKLKARSLFSEKAWEMTSKKDALPLLENPQSENLAKTQSEVIQKVQKNENGPKKKDCEFWCKLCQVGTLSVEVMNAHKLGKKHVRRSRCEQYVGTDSFNQNKSSVLVHPVEDVSGIGKNINLVNLNRALDEVTSEDHMLLDTVGHEERPGKTLDYDVVDIELPADVTANKKLEEWSCALCQISATSEKGLNEHLLGKKHKSKEAAVRSS